MEENTIIHCPNCGAINEINSLYCGECGYKFEHIENLEQFVKEKESYDSAQIANNSVKTDFVISSLGNIILTEKYVKYAFTGWGKEYFKCIFLKDISSIELGFKSFPLLLVVTVIAFCVAIFSYNYKELSAIIGVICLIIFFATRQYALIITAHSNSKIKAVVGTGSGAKEFANNIIFQKSRIDETNKGE